MSDIAKWYVIHTFSGYEKKVENNIRRVIDNRGLHEQIVDIRVPEEVDTERQSAKSDGENSKNAARRKIFPGYVFVKMIMSDDSWHTIRNIRGVTGFVGPESKPVPLTETEIYNMSFETKVVSVDFEVGDTVRITDGPLEGYMGKVTELDAEKNKVKLSVDLFMGRETVVDLEISQVETIS